MSEVTKEKKPFNWEKFQKNMCYTDEEMATFRADPRRRRGAEALIEANRRTIVAEVVESHGCAAGFKLADTLEVSAAGLVKNTGSAPNMCLFAVAPMTIHAAMAFDRVMEGLDPDGMWWNHFSCQDAGYCNGSWGRVTFRVSVK
jgi:hypothetical protein